MTNEPKDTAKKNLPRLSAPDSPFATVLVGSEKKRFVVHQDLLIYHSEFFRAALTGKFKEADEKTVPLPEDKEVIFEFFVHWLYHKELPTTNNANAELLEEWMDEDEDESDSLINLHVFADKYGVERLKADTLNGLFMHLRAMDWLPSVHSIAHAYEHLPDKSPLLDFLVDIYCHIAEETWTAEDVQILPSSFLASVLERLTKAVNGRLRVLKKLKICDYHEHKDEDERKACLYREIFTERPSGSEQNTGWNEV